MKAEPVPPPDMSDKLRRFVWQIFWVLVFRPTPTFMHGWRCVVLRCFGARIGKRVHPYPAARIWAPWNLRMEDGSCLGNGAECYNVAPVRLGRDAVISQRAYLCTAGHDLIQPGFALVAAPIYIGDDAWIAAAAFVGPGVHVGRRAVAGACSVVTKDVPENTIVAGNTAQQVGLRPEVSIGTTRH